MKKWLLAAFTGVIGFQTGSLAQAVLPDSQVDIEYVESNHIVRFHIHPPAPQGHYLPHDIFMTTNPAANISGLDGTNWTLVARTEFDQTDMVLTNIWRSKPCFRLGTLLDSDNDQLTDAYEIAVSHTDPARWDSTGNGVSDGYKSSPKRFPWYLEQARISAAVVYANSPTATQGGACAQCTVYLPSPAPVGGTVVHYRFDGTASLGSDFTVMPSGGSAFYDQTLTIPAGLSASTFKLCASGGKSYSSFKLYADITLTSCTSCRVDNSPTEVNIVTIGLPSIVVYALPPWLRSPSHTYGTNAAGFYFIRGGESTNALKVSLSVNGTAVKGIDYSTLPAAIVFPANVRTNWLPLPIISHDAIADKTVKLTIASAPGYEIDPTNGTATINIAASGRPPPPVVQVAATISHATVAKPGRLVFSRSGSTNDVLRVYYDVIGDTVVGYTNGQHIISYNYLPGIVDIEAGKRIAVVPVVPVNPPSSGEMVTVVVKAEGDYSIGTYKTATVQIDRP